jgi:hypothetical protein
LEGTRRQGRGGFHEDDDTSQGAREQLFPPSPSTYDILAYYGLRVGCVGRADARLVSKVKARISPLISPRERASACVIGVVVMAAIPTQLPWRRFVQLLCDLGYRPLKPHRGSLRQFFNPTRNPRQISFHEPHRGDTLHKASLFAALRKLQLTLDEFVQLLDKH